MASPPVIGAVHAPPQVETESIPEIKPMRRGRPTRVGEEGNIKVTMPSPSPLRPSEGDPFSALDAKSHSDVDPSIDDVSSRFPALDDFSILHEEGNRFSFDGKSETLKQPRQNISQRVTNALADDAFAQAKGPSIVPPTQDNVRPSSMGSKPLSRPLSSQHLQSQHESRASSSERQYAERRPMISTGTMTSPPSSPKLKAQQVSNRPVWRVPPSPEPRSLSQPRKSNADQSQINMVRTEAALRPPLVEQRSKSQTDLTESAAKRKSLEANQRSANIGDGEENLRRSASAKTKSRPSSTQSSKPSILRRISRDKFQGEDAAEELARLTSVNTTDAEEGAEGHRIDSNVEYLKAIEVEDASKRREKRLSSGSKHIKRASLPSVSLSGTKQLLAGRFGEAFRKFEHSNSSDRKGLSESPPQDSNDLTPIAGSEATDGRSDDGRLEEVEEMSPEVRRELERRRLSEEEKRVADAAAAYKQRIAEGGARPIASNKAASIQSKVRSLLDETGRGSPSPTKTAFGYGKYTDQQPQSTSSQQLESLPVRTSSRPPSNNTISRPSAQSNNLPPKPDSHTSRTAAFVPPPLTATNSAPASSVNLTNRAGPSLSARPPRPSGPPKPQPKPQSLRKSETASPSPLKRTAVPISSTPIQQNPSSSSQQQSLDGPPNDDWETNFSKRYPDLSGLEMVETEIDQRDVSANPLSKSNSLGREMRVRDD